MRIGLLIITSVCIGCASHPAPRESKPATRPVEAQSALITSADACATKLEFVCERLLQYYASHRALPPTIEELRTSVATDVDLKCPLSNVAYVYNPHGVRLGETRWRIVLWDASPVHSGMRWGIGLGETIRGGAMEAQVLALPPQQFNPQ
jgi:hypothetical protein